MAGKVEPPFTATEAHCVFEMAVSLLEKIEDLDIESRRPYSPLPRGVFRCGEAGLVVSALVALLAHVYPEAMPNDEIADLAATHFRRVN